MRGLYKKLLLIWMLCLPIFLTGQVLTGEIISLNQPGCAPPHEGSIIVSGVNGSLPYTYTLNGSVVQSNGVFSGLPLGDHTIIISDGVGDLFTISFSIEILSQLSISVFDLAHVECFGNTDGFISVIASSGTPPFQYSIDNGNTFQLNGNFNNLGNGIYQIIANDGAGCADTISAEVLALSQINILALNQEDIDCYGQATGSIQVLGELGTSPYQYSIDGINYQTNELFSNISSGTYQFWVEDVNGCKDSISIEFSDPTQLEFTDFTYVDINCFGGSNGSISFNYTGGEAPYTFEINDTSATNIPLFGNLSAGDYSISIIDDQGCTIDSVVSVIQPDSIEVLILEVDQPSCFGGDNGSITIGGAGGVLPYDYKYAGSSWQNNGTFSGLSAGDYILKVRDANGCIRNLDYTLGEPDELTLSSISVVDVYCNTSTNGSIEVQANGGIIDYEYSIDGGIGQSSPLFSDLSFGVYTLEVFDQNACTDEIEIEIEQTIDLEINSIQVSPVICGITSTGSMDVIGSGGMAPYEYSIDGGISQTSSTFTNVSVGMHTINLYANDGCFVTTNIFMPEESPIDAFIINLLNPICEGSATGSIELGASGGSSPYLFSNDNGLNWQASPTFNNLLDSTYIFSIRDQNGCVTDTLISIDEQNQLLIDLISISGSICPNESNGNIEVLGQNGSLPYTYSINGGAFNSNSNFTNLDPGDHEIIFEDGNGCSADTIFTIEALENPSVTIDSAISPTCNSYNDGVIFLSEAGTELPYQYSFEGGPFSPNSYFTGLIAGNYNIQVQDANNCESTVDIELIDSPLFIATIDSVQHIECKNEESGFIYYSLSGGQSPYSFRVNGGMWQAANSSIGPLYAGNYVLDFIDDNGCVITMNEVINEPAEVLDAQILSTLDVDCLSDSIGVFIGEAIGGVSPYSFSIDSIDFQSSSTFNGLAPGDYTSYVVDANNCTASVGFSINANSTIDLAWAAVNPPSCESVSNGLLSVGVIAGSYPFSFQINGSLPQTGGTFSGLSEGYYLIEVEDDLGCAASIDTIINSDQTLQIAIDSVQNILCVADSSGGIWLDADGGTPGYSYYIEGALMSGNSQMGLTNGVYQTWVVDAIGCTDSIQVAIIQESLLQGSIFAQQNILCNNGSLGSVTVNGTTGSSPYLYSIDGSNFDTLNTFNDLEEGLYSVTIEDNSGCQVEVDVDITLLTEIEVQLQSIIEPSCFGMDNGIASFSIVNGIGPYSYSLNNGDQGPDNIYDDISAGQQVIYAVDSQGCNDSLVFTMNQPDPITISIDSIGLASCYGMDDAYISISALNEIGNVLYSIQPDGSSNTSGLFEGLTDDSYVLTIVDQNLCNTDTSIIIESPSSLEVSVVEINSLDCYGDSNGIVQLIVNGGVSPFSFEVDSIDFGNNPYINNLDYGLHHFVINDQNDCQTSGDFSLDQPDSLSIQFALINGVSCNGLDNGTAFFIADGGVGNYSFELNASIFSDDGAFSDLPPQSYSLIIYDSLFCSHDFDFSITEPDSLVIDSVIFENPICYADTNGSFTVLVSGGTPDYNYFVPGIGSSEDSAFINMEGGAYFISVTDEKGCNTSDIVILYEPDEFLVEVLAVSPPLCFGDSNGTAVLQAEGGSGTPSYGLSFDDLTYASELQNLSSGMHLIYAIDSLGCSDSTSAFIPEVDSLVFDGMVQDVSCFGINDGEISFNPSGNSEDFLFSQDEVNWIDTNMFYDMYSGDQSFFMLDEFGCLKDTTITISQPDSLYISSLTLFPVTCSDEFGGAMSVEIEGGVQPYESTLGSTSINGSTVFFENLSVGEYQIITTDSNDCVFFLDTILTEIDSVYASINDIELNCYGDTDGIATVNYSGGSGDYYFLWNNNSADSTETTQANLVADVTYSVVVTDVLDSNCFAIAEVTPSQPPLIEFELFQYSPSCDPEDIWVNVELLNGGVEPFQYVVNDEDPVDSGIFTDFGLTSTRFEVIDSSECSVEQWIIPTNPNLIDAYFDVSDEEVSMAEGEIVFTDLSDNTAYLKWDFGDEIVVEGDIGNPAIAEFTTGLMEQPMHNYTTQGEYVAKLSAASDFGCEDEYERTIIVKEDHRVFIPNSFTPDGDGINDIFLVQGSTIDDKGFKLTIFDRSGTMVFQSFDINVGWNGLSQNGKELRPEVYVFIVSYYSGGRLFEKNGTVTLLR